VPARRLRRHRWIAAGLVLALAVTAVVLLAGGERREPPAEPRGFQTLYYLREAEGRFTEAVLDSEQHLEERESSPANVETRLGSVTCVPEPPAPLPSATLTCTAEVERRVPYSHGSPFARHTWRGTMRLDPHAATARLVSLRRAEES
jgi:hypothetical protein